MKFRNSTQNYLGSRIIRTVLLVLIILVVFWLLFSVNLFRKTSEEGDVNTKQDDDKKKKKFQLFPDGDTPVTSQEFKYGVSSSLGDWVIEFEKKQKLANQPHRPGRKQKDIKNKVIP
jgi:hypothetical protein